MRQNRRKQDFLFKGHHKLISPNLQREYERLKYSISQFLRNRTDFQKTVDTSLIDLAAKLFADWLYLEEILSSEKSKDQIWKYADGLAKIHHMLMSVLDELKITPKSRQKIAKELAEVDEVSIRLKKLIEGK